MIKLFNKKTECCGCELCSFVCPMKIIFMEEDEEGFFYPKIVEPEKCIECHRCEQVCPEKVCFQSPRQIIAVHTGYVKQDNEIKKSASGGIATAISQGFVLGNGIVYGVRYSKDFSEVYYSRAETLLELEMFRTSKYCSSKKNDIFQKVLTDLRDGHRVLFVGLPCEIAALHNLVRDKDDNLYTIELVCHGVTSPRVQKEVVANLCLQRGDFEMQEFSVRYKKEGWKPYFIFAKFGSSENFITPFRTSDYGVAFHYLKRPSCNHCRFKYSDDTYGLQADITLGDNHGVRSDDPSYNHWGSSVVFVHSEKGKELLSDCEGFINLFDATVSKVGHNRALYEAIPARINRANFSKIFRKKGLEAACSSVGVKLIDWWIFSWLAVKRKLSVIKCFVTGVYK